ncbi:MAG: hypothetical protein Q4F66_03075 [Clostridium sp.]|nr:hypothetical protein [Clostridium sp.]
MIKKSTAFIFAIITALTGVYIGMNIKENFNTNMVLSVIIIFNSLLIMNTTKKNK